MKIVRKELPDFQRQISKQFPQKILAQKASAGVIIPGNHPRFETEFGASRKSKTPAETRLELH